MIAPMIVVLDEGRDLGFEITWQEVVLQQEAALQPWCQRSILPWVWGWFGAPCRPNRPEAVILAKLWNVERTD